MGYNIGPKIGIDGEAQFRQQIKAINNEYKTLQAQTKALTAEFDKNGDQQGKLRMQTQQLEKEIDAQKRAVQEMENALEKARNSTDANADAVTRWEEKLWNAKATVSNLEKELQDTEDALRQMENGIEDTSDAADDAGGAVSDFGDILKGNLVAGAIWEGLKEGAEILKELGEAAIDAASDLRAEGAQFEQTFGEMEQAATDALQSVEKQTGISATRIKGNFSTVHAFAKTMGAESADALDIAARAMAAAADNAAYYDKTVEEVTETIQAYIKGNYANDAALGIASTETTRNAAALERYGKAFKELSEAQKVDTLLAMVEAGNKASGAMGQAAREAGEWTNVTGELEDAQKQLLAVIGEPVLEAAIPIVQELTSAMRELADVSPAEELRRSMEGLSDAMEDANSTYRSTMAATMGGATVAEQYIDRLEVLEEAGLKTAQAHAEYERTVELLKIAMPGLNLTISEETGLLEQSTDALRDQVEAWKEAALQKAMYEKMSAQVEAYGEAQLTLAEAQQKQLDLQNQQKTDLQTLASLLGIVGAESIKTSMLVNDALPGIGDTTVYEIYDKAGNKLATLNDTMFKADSEAVKLAKSYNKSTAALSQLSHEIAESGETLAGYEAEMDATTALMDEFKAETEDNTEAQEAQKAAISETQAALLELKEAYATAKENTRAMLDSSIGLWDSVAAKSEWTAKKVLDNWRSQMKAFDQYSANLQKAQEMGLSDGIIDALSDGSQQSMQILNAMVNQSKYSAGEINAAFTDLNLAKDGTVDVLMELDGSLQEGYDKLVEDARAAGLEIVDGIVQAIQDNAYKVGDAIEDIPIAGGKGYEAEAQGILDSLGKAPATWETARAGTDRAVASMIQNFNITQLPGESGEEFAERVAEKITNDARWKGGGLGG